jgi:hypothetical protein
MFLGAGILLLVFVGTTVGFIFCIISENAKLYRLLYGPPIPFMNGLLGKYDVNQSVVYLEHRVIYHRGDDLDNLRSAISSKMNSLIEFENKEFLKYIEENFSNAVYKKFVQLIENSNRGELLKFISSNSELSKCYEFYNEVCKNAKNPTSGMNEFMNAFKDFDKIKNVCYDDLRFLVNGDVMVACFCLMIVSSFFACIFTCYLVDSNVSLPKNLFKCISFENKSKLETIN